MIRELRDEDLPGIAPVARAAAGRDAYVWVGVVPEARGRGLGGALWELAAEHLSRLPVERVNADVLADPAGERFLTSRGFAFVRVVVVSAVDPRAVDPGELEARRARAEADGYRLIPFADVDPEALYRLHFAATDDEPNEEPLSEYSFEDWVTDNDEHNAPMLAINRRLGYAPFVERHGYVKEL